MQNSQPTHYSVGLAQTRPNHERQESRCHIKWGPPKLETPGPHISLKALRFQSHSKLSVHSIGGPYFYEGVSTLGDGGPHIQGLIQGFI